MTQLIPGSNITILKSWFLCGGLGVCERIVAQGARGLTYPLGERRQRLAQYYSVGLTTEASGSVLAAVCVVSQ